VQANHLELQILFSTEKDLLHAHPQTLATDSESLQVFQQKLNDEEC